MNESNTTKSTATKHELLFGVDSHAFQQEEQEWYQGHLDIVIPMMFIAAGLFQFILRKWLLPVSEDVISKLENQFPSQGLIYMPEFGFILAVFGFILLLLFNI